MPNFPRKSKNPDFGTFWAHFPHFGGKIFFPGKSGSVTLKFIWVSSTMPKFRQKDERTEGQADPIL